MTKDLRPELRDLILSDLRQLPRIDRTTIRQAADEVFRRVEAQRRSVIDAATRESIVTSLIEDVIGLGPIDALLADDQVTEIMINGPAHIYVERRGIKMKSDLRFADQQQLRRALDRMIAPTGRRLDESMPYADFALENGARVNAIVPPLAVDGATVTIRKFLQSIRSIHDLVGFGTLDFRMARFLEACMQARINMLFSGATGSGKTTTLEVLSACIDPRERIITIEDTPELSLHQEHVVRLIARQPNTEGRGEIPIRVLVRNCLRMRPTRIILGELRGEEAMDYLQAQNSGHRGCLAVLHASSPRDAMTRLETMALYAGLNLPSWAIRQQIASGLQLIIQHEQLGDGRRVLTHLTEVAGYADGEIQLRDVFAFEGGAAAPDQPVRGRFVAKGEPGFAAIMRERGVAVEPALFA